MTKFKRIVLGIDPGSLITGFGVIGDDGNQFHAIHYGIIRTIQKQQLALRLNTIYSELTALIKKYQPHDLAIESLFHAKNAQSALKLGHARGVALLSGAASGLTIAEYTPREIKKGITGSGAASKEQMMKMVRLLLKGVENPTADAADALAIALFHCHLRPWLLKQPLTPPEEQLR